MGILTRFGIGNASVELEVPRDVKQGEEVEGTLRITGGNSPQDVKRVYAAVRSKREDTGDNDTGPVPFTLTEYELISEPFTIEPDDERTENVTITIPANTPVTTISTGRRFGYEYPVWIETGLDVDWALDPEDDDSLNVAPGGVFKAVHQAMVNELSFTVHSRKVDSSSYHMNYDGYPYDISYRPSEGASFNVDEVDVKLGRDTETGLQILVDVDLKGMSLTSDNVRTEHEFTETDTGAAATRLRRIINDATSQS